MLRKLSIPILFVLLISCTEKAENSDSAPTVLENLLSDCVFEVNRDDFHEIVLDSVYQGLDPFYATRTELDRKVYFSIINADSNRIDHFPLEGNGRIYQTNLPDSAKIKGFHVHNKDSIFVKIRWSGASTRKYDFDSLIFLVDIEGNLERKVSYGGEAGIKLVDYKVDTADNSQSYALMATQWAPIFYHNDELFCGIYPWKLNNSLGPKHFACRIRLANQERKSDIAEFIPWEIDEWIIGHSDSMNLVYKIPQLAFSPPYLYGSFKCQSNIYQYNIITRKTKKIQIPSYILDTNAVVRNGNLMSEFRFDLPQFGRLIATHDYLYRINVPIDKWSFIAKQDVDKELENSLFFEINRISHGLESVCIPPELVNGKALTHAFFDQKENLWVPFTWESGPIDKSTLRFNKYKITLNQNTSQ